jgi:hypothetical protein
MVESTTGPARRSARATIITALAALAALLGAVPAAHAERSTLDASATSTCVVRTDAGVSCWGDFSTTPPVSGGISGQAPIAASEFIHPTPTDVAPARPAANVSAGDIAYNCEVRTDATAGCWGWGWYFDSDYWPTFRVVPVEPVREAGSSSPAADLIDVAVNDREACAVRVDGTVLCWRGGSEDYARPIAGLLNATSITSDGVAFCARRDTGAVACWDRGLSRGLGPMMGPAAVYTTGAGPADVQQLTDAVQVSGTCALRQTGAVTCWKISHRPQTGEEYIAFTDPTEIPGVSGATDLSTSSTHGCAVVTDGQAVCWGSNSSGQLARPTSELASSAQALAIEGLPAATDVSAGIGTSCARLADASLRCWGSAGRLGNPDVTTASPTPVEPAGDLRVAASTDLRPGDPIPTPRPTPTATPTPTPTPTATPTPTDPWSYDATGRAYLRTLTTGAVPLSGMLNGTFTPSTGLFVGKLPLRDASVRLQTLGIVPVTATIAFIESGSSTAALTGGALSLTTRQYVRLRSVKALGINLVSNTCVTKQPATITMRSTAAGFSPGAGGTVTGVFTLPSLTNCGALGAIVSGLTAGSGNAATLTLAPVAPAAS